MKKKITPIKEKTHTNDNDEDNYLTEVVPNISVVNNYDEDDENMNSEEETDDENVASNNNSTTTNTK